MKATEITAGLEESNGRLLLGIWHDSPHVTCGLTACTPGSAPGPTLGNEYGKTLPFYCRRALSDTAIRLSVCLSVRRAAGKRVFKYPKMRALLSGGREFS